MIFHIMVPGNFDPGAPFARRAEPVCIAEKFSWFAALLPPFWAITHGLWLELAIIILALVGLDLAGPFIGSEAAVWLYIAGAVWLGLDAANLRISALARQNYTLGATSIASSADQAELDFLKKTVRSASAEPHIPDGPGNA